MEGLPGEAHYALITSIAKVRRFTTALARRTLRALRIDRYDSDVIWSMQELSELDAPNNR